VPRYVLSLPSWAWYIGFFVIPIGYIVWYSFGYKPSILAGGGTIATDKLSMANYSEAFDETFLTVFRRTLEVAVLGTLLCLVVAFPFAYWLATKVAQKWRGIMLALVIVPFWTSFLVRTLAWRIVLAQNGLLSNLLVDVGARETKLALLDTRAAVQIGVVYNYLPLMIFPLFVALDRLDPALREASKDLGASRWKTFTQVTLPLAMPGVVAGLLLVFIPLAGDYITASVLGGAAGNMAGALVATQFLQNQNWALGSAMAMVLIGTILLALVVVAVLSLLGRTLIRHRRSVTIEAAVA
jgi:spermidine/putrescine transport system permease protein